MITPLPDENKAGFEKYAFERLPMNWSQAGHDERLI